MFSYGDRVIRFKAPYSLEHDTSVKAWDNEYLVGMAKYSHNPQPEDEYNDMVLYLINAPPLGSPSGGAAERSEAEGGSWVRRNGLPETATRYYPTNDTPSDLASSATSLKEGGKSAANPNFYFSLYSTLGLPPVP